MADESYRGRWDQWNGGHEPQENIRPGLHGYPNTNYSITSSSQRETSIPSYQQQRRPQTPEDRTQTRGSSRSRGNRLRKPPPRQTSLPPTSSRQFPPTFAHTREVPMEALSPRVPQDAITPPANVQNTYGYMSATPQQPRQLRRHDSQAQATYQDNLPLPPSFPQGPHESYPVIRQAQAHIHPSSRNSNRGRSTSTEPIASSAFCGPRPYEQQRNREEVPHADVSTAYNVPRQRANRENTQLAPSNSSADSAPTLHSPQQQQRNPEAGYDPHFASQTSMTASNHQSMAHRANRRVNENNVDRISRPQPINGITNRLPPPSPRPYTNNQARTGNGRELPECRPTVTPGDQSWSSSQNNVPHPPQSRDSPADALLLDPSNIRSIQGYYYSESHNFLNQVVNKLRIKKAFHWANPNFFHRYAVISGSSPHSYQLPGRFYKPDLRTRSPPETYSRAEIQNMYPDLDQDEIAEIQQDQDAEKRAVRGHIKYLDVFRRKTRGKVEDRYVDPADGRLGVLVIQASSPVYDSRNRTTWRRTYVENISPYFVRLAYWPTGGIRKSFDQWGRDEWIYAGLRWLPSCIGILICMLAPTDAEGQVRSNGFYDPFSYRFWSYPKTARNVYENQPSRRNLSPIGHRIIRPRKLCFLDEISRENPNGLLDQADWNGKDPTYIFISYTAQGQFERRCQTAGDCRCDQCVIAIADAKALHEAARVATKNACVPAYWTDQCCMSTNKAEHSKDIYTISDVTRNAHSLVIILGESRGGKTKKIPELLVGWGTRMWTFPEIILAPPNKQILIYRRGDEDNPLPVSRLELSHQTWAKDEVRLRVRELIDHYDNSLTLSRLELVVILLDCLLSRETKIFAEGDLAYALMGMLRLRPTTDYSDSAFQAFARLSLMNDSDRLLERMICLLPKDQMKFNSRNRHYWANLDDFWDAKLWDVEPICQIAAIGMEDTVIIDGAYAATIHWNSFQRVAVTTKETWTRMISRLLLRLTPVYLLSGITALLLHSTQAGVVFMILAAVFVLMSPILILHIYGGKVWSTQPWLFGFEGYLSIKEIEKKIFGFPQDRLTWAPYASTLSQHRPHESFLKNECRGMDPTKDAATKELVDRGPTADYGESRVFTLVDTNTMTVTLFSAERPPVVALLCGSEGGMQRAIMCSYDWATQTLYRETVLRMETRVLEKMSRVGRVSFGLRRNVQGKPDTWRSNCRENTELADEGNWV